jgi:hypothetical protein
MRQNKSCFMKGLSTKLKELLSLNTTETLPEFMSNAIIADDSIRALKEGKKRKAMAVPSSSAPLKYQMVYTPRNNPPPHP